MRVVTPRVWTVRTCPQASISAQDVEVGPWCVEVENGPNLPFTDRSRCCGRSPLYGHSCIAQHFVCSNVGLGTNGAVSRCQMGWRIPAICVDRRERLRADLYGPFPCRGAASPDRPFVHRAAFPVSNLRQCGIKLPLVLSRGMTTA